MSYVATVVKVLIASPGDVAKERELIRDVIHEWNAIHADDRQVVLMPVAWETHSSPAMGDRPQGIVNKQVATGCDLLVAVFWTRLGSPTGISQSGTVEEINEHLANGKPAMIYFSSAPVRIDSVDSQQYGSLQEFKSDLHKRGLVHDYEDLSSFRANFARHLAQTVIREFAPGALNADSVAMARAEPIPSLSDAARELLLEAARDAHGVVMRLGSIGGTFIKTNNRNFVQGDDLRSAARWRSAVDELQNMELVEDRAGKGEVFFVTDAGYRAADLIRA